MNISGGGYISIWAGAIFCCILGRFFAVGLGLIFRVGWGMFFQLTGSDFPSWLSLVFSSQMANVEINGHFVEIK